MRADAEKARDERDSAERTLEDERGRHAEGRIESRRLLEAEKGRHMESLRALKEDQHTLEEAQRMLEVERGRLGETMMRLDECERGRRGMAELVVVLEGKCAALEAEAAQVKRELDSLLIGMTVI